MKILIDVGHPAHVHYFKYFVEEFQKNGNEVLFSARNRGEIFELLESYNFNYFNRGPGYDSIIKKLFNLFYADSIIFFKALKFKPDIFLGFGSSYAARVSKMLFKPCLLFDDTEFSTIETMLYKPFANYIFTPKYFRKNLGKKQIKFNGLMELSYLHPKRFKSSPQVHELLGISKETKYVVLRFVAFKAIHDHGIKGFTTDKKIELVNKLKKYTKVFISSERELPDELNKYKINLPAKLLHSVLSGATLYIGDSQTTTTEACCLGIPAIRCNSFAKSSVERANFIYLEEKNLLYNYNEKDVDKAINKAIELIQIKNLKHYSKVKWRSFIDENIDTTQLLLYLVNNYPNSISHFKSNPEIIRDIS